MSDFNSSLPVRTENNGDVVVKIVDGTITSQALAIDATGKVVAKLNDGNGNAVTSQANGAQQALDVGINVGGVQVDPRSIRALTSSDVVTANQGTAAALSGAWPVAPTDGTNSQSYTAAGEAKVSVTEPLPAGTNVIGKVSQDTSPWITKDQADGPVAPGTAASFSELVGGQYNSTLPTLTTGQQAALQVDAKGQMLASQPDATSLNAQVRLQDGAGNAITSATAGSTRPLDVALRDGSGSLYSPTNPIPVAISADLTGVEVNDYNTAATVAAGGTSNHDYTVTAGKTFLLKQVHASASGKMKVELQIETAAGSGTFNTKYVFFNSTSNPNIDVTINGPISVAAGARVRLIRTNRDLLAQDVYSTIDGQEV